ncbi:hypothetical protein KDU71_07600 [Carboxylicivirga sediminis]|uniref:ParB/Sulfiredoxin domain-containing protein n=1 Tax=Carboxylicivirga sediminis TaxID=2006564 RepID=A0A941F2A2_9BACT|nr:hypothetical protein [Carboxylicivirga sediminis]MBR8535421.1 hypothetical protein [Carboxylicivirga sediminis]
MKLSDLKPKEGNPRYIKDDKFEDLVRSIIEFPKMMSKRPIVFDSKSNNESLGGNMRLRALLEIKTLGRDVVLERLKAANKSDNIKLLEPIFKGIIPDEWVMDASDLSEEEKKRFIIVDNVGFGSWDMDMLANEWNQEELEDWGLDIHFPEPPEEEEEEPIDKAVIRVYVDFDSADEAKDLYNQLLSEGHEAKMSE